MTPFHAVFKNRKVWFNSEKRPDGLPADRVPDQKDQRQHEVHQARLEQSPIDIAEDLQQEMKELGCLSIRAFARQTGRNWSLVSKYLKILTLPDDILEFIRDNDTPEVRRKCSMKNLVRLASQRDGAAFQAFGLK